MGAWLSFGDRRCLPYAVCVCVIGILTATPVSVAAQSQAKRVLLLFDEDETLPGLSVLDRTFRSTMSAGLENGVEFFTESLNVAQFPEEDHDRVLRDYYVKKYSSRKLDLIVGVMGPAVTFLLRYADEIAPGVPAPDGHGSHHGGVRLRLESKRCFSVMLLLAMLRRAPLSIGERLREDRVCILRRLVIVPSGDTSSTLLRIVRAGGSCAQTPGGCFRLR